MLKDKAINSNVLHFSIAATSVSDTCGTSNFLPIVKSSNTEKILKFEKPKRFYRRLNLIFNRSALTLSETKNHNFAPTFTTMRQRKYFNISKNLTLISITIVLMLIFHSSHFLLSVDAAALNPINSKNSEQQNTDKKNVECNIHNNPNVHSIMDRICELCHDMYSHRNANMRAECR